MKRVLFIYSPRAAHVGTTFQYVDAFRRHSRYQIDYLSCLSEGSFDLSGYDIVWLNYCARLVVPDAVSSSVTDAISRYNGPTFVALQDEYELTNLARQELLRIGASHVMTCVPARSIDYAYPRSMFPQVHFHTILTGYVPDELGAATAGLPLASRPIHLGYRGRSLNWRYGTLAAQKIDIGLKARSACRERAIPCDIAVDEEARIYGDAWFDFIRSCRATLGSESGSNVFDFDGAIASRFLPSPPRPEDVPDLVQLIAEREREISMGQISPRIFEAAALGSALVLVRGSYSEAIEPEEHYLPVEPDWSNLGTVIERLADVDALQAMADRARQHLIDSGRFSYATFVARIDALFEEAMATWPSAPAQPALSSATPLPSTDRPYGNDPLVIELMTEVQRLYREIDRTMSERNHFAAELNQLGERYTALLDARLSNRVKTWVAARVRRR